MAWGLWAGGGLAQASEAVVQRLRRGLLPEMEPELAVGAGAGAGGAGQPAGVMDVDWARFAAAPGAAQVPCCRDLPDVA